MEWPLIGRDALLRRLTASLVGSTTGSLTLSGDEGVGKTRLASELARLAAARGRTVDRVWASPSAAAIPFGVIGHLVALPARAVDQPLLMSALLAELGRRSGPSGPAVLIVDDAHHLDDHTAALLHQAARHHIASVVLTARSGEPVPAAVTQLWKDRAADRVDVGPLSAEATRQLAEAVLGGPVDGLAMHELWQRSAGNPLFLRELLLGGLESGALVAEAGLWRTSGQLAPTSRLSEIVRARLGKLSPRESAAVECLAVGHDVELETLEIIAGGRSIESLEERHLIELDQLGNRSIVRLSHPVYGEVIAGDMPRTRARRVRRRLADQLEQTGLRRSDDLLRLALWRVDGGGASSAGLMLAAARKALASFDAALAERLARAALAQDSSSVPAQLVLGEALASQQRVDEADAVLSAAEQRAHEEDHVAQLALARANMLYFRAGRIDEAAALLKRANERLTDQAWRDEVESLLVLFRSAAGQLRAVAAGGRRLLARPAARPRAVVHVLTYSSIANVMLGRFAEAEEQVRIGLELASQVSDELPLNGELLRINGVMANAYAGRSRRALEMGRQGYRAALAGGVPEMAAMWGMNVAECLLLSGEIDTALHTMLGALAVTRERDPLSVRAIDAALASLCATWLGRHDLARELQQEASELARDVRSRIWLDRASAWISWAEAGPETAADAALAAARQAVVDTHLVWGAWLYHDAARLGRPEPAANRLEALAERTEGQLVAAMALHARALAQSDAVALERAASAFEQLGSLLYAAEAAAHAQQAYLARDRLRLARLAGARAALLAAACQGARTPPLIDNPGVRLTARELEIARLAANGLTSRDVADRLEISVRTVDNHLGTIYSKLSVSSRTELRGLLGAATTAPTTDHPGHG